MSTEFKMLGLRTTVYKVDDLAKAKDWYTKAFNKKPYFEEEFYIGFDIGGYELGLIPDSTNSLTKTDNVISYWGVADIRLIMDHLILIGATMHEKSQNVGGNIIIASVKDPWGNVIGLIKNPNFRPTEDLKF